MPSYCVTLIDRDEAEFPVRVWGTDLTHEQIVYLAIEESRRLEATEPRWRPAFPLTDIITECWNGAEIASR
jgi:hypothetical protein